MSTSSHQSTISAQIDLFLAGMGQGFNPYLEGRGRLEEALRLDAKSDAELAALGVRRDAIAEHVFRDVLAH